MQNLKHSDRARTLIHTWSHIKNMANNSSLDRSSSVNCAKGIERFYCQMQMYETNQRHTLDHTPCWKTHLIENFNKHICIIWSCLSFDAPHFICASHSMSNVYASHSITICWCDCDHLCVFCVMISLIRISTKNITKKELTALVK